MRIPRPKSVPGLFLWGITTVAIFLFGRVLWVLLSQNIENVAADRGYDKLLSKHWSEIMNWLGQNVFWLSIAAAFFFGGALALWAYLGLQAFFGSPSPRDPLIRDDADNARLADMNKHLSLTYEEIGFALGSDLAWQYEIAIAQIETFLVNLARGNAIPIPSLRADGAETGVLRAFAYLNYIRPTLHLDDREELRKRAEECVPALNKKFSEELREELEYPKKQRQSDIVPEASNATFASSDAKQNVPEYAYPKAALQIREPIIQGEAGSDGRIMKIVGYVDVFNDTYLPLTDCRIRLISVERNGMAETVDRSLRIGDDAGNFKLSKGAKVRISLIKRDFKDSISCPPFLLLLKGMEYPIHENESAKLLVEMSSIAKDNTIAVITIDTRTGRNFDITITEQRVKPQ